MRIQKYWNFVFVFTTHLCWIKKDDGGRDRTFWIWFRVILGSLLNPIELWMAPIQQNGSWIMHQQNRCTILQYYPSHTNEFTSIAKDGWALLIDYLIEWKKMIKSATPQKLPKFKNNELYTCICLNWYFIAHLLSMNCNWFFIYIIY